MFKNMEGTTAPATLCLDSGLKRRFASLSPIASRIMAYLCNCFAQFMRRAITKVVPRDTARRKPLTSGSSTPPSPEQTCETTNADMCQSADDGTGTETFFEGSTEGLSIDFGSPFEKPERAARLKKSAEETERMAKIIDEVAFETNLLAMDVAAKVRNAGIAEESIATIVEEARILAQKSAEASRFASRLKRMSKAKPCDEISERQKVAKMLMSVKTSADRVRHLASEIRQNGR